MAQKVQVLLVCDLHDDEVEGTETISFGLDGSQYEIDLCAAHATEIREDLASYVGAARRAGRSAAAGRRSSTPRASRPSSSGKNVSEVREWARANGYEVSERGRIASTVLEAYEAAH